MKIHTKYLFGLFGLYFLLSGCRKDPFSQIVTIELPNHESALSVSTSLMDGDTVISVLVSQSLGILEKKEHTIIEDAQVKILFGGRSLAELSFDPESGYYQAHLTEPLVLQEGTYRLEASAPGFSDVWSQQIVGEKVTLKKAIFEYEGTITEDGKAHEIKVWIDDPVGENYYALDFIALGRFDFDTSLYRQHIYVDSNDPTIEYGWSEDILLTDNAFEGRSYTARFYIPYWPLDENYLDQSKLIISLKTLSPDKYFFERSRSIYEDARDFPFSEPVLIHDNIEGGHGLFSVTQISEIEIDLSR